MVPGTPAASGAIPLDGSSGQPIAYLPALVVTDAQGSVLPEAATQAMSATTTPQTYTYTVTPNTASLASATYPVTIDPSVTITPQGSAGQNTFVSQADPSTSYSTATDFYNGVTSTYGLTRGLVQFENLPVLMPGAVITGAWVNLAWQSQANGQWTTPAQPFSLSFKYQARNIKIPKPFARVGRVDITGRGAFCIDSCYRWAGCSNRPGSHSMVK